MLMRRFGWVLSALFLLLAGTAQAQLQNVALGDDDPLLKPPKKYKVLGLNVEGTEDPNVRFLVIRQSGITMGQDVLIPGDDVFSEAIRRLYRLRIFSDIEILSEKTLDAGVYLLVRVKEEPRLGAYSFTGVKGGDKEDLRKKVPLLRGQAVKPGDIERTKRIIKDYFQEKGRPLTSTRVEQTVTPENRVNLEFVVDRGPKVEVQDIVIDGNAAMSDWRIRRSMKETKKNRWWRFWKGESFKPEKYEEDKDNIIAKYNEKGYYDARIVRDTTYLTGLEEGEPGMIVELEIEEGPQYHIRNITWDGNTAYTDEQLTRALGIAKGEPYNSKTLETNLYANAQNSDVSSLYYNQGYVRFGAVPTISVAGGDSLDLHFDIQEGDIYNFGDISIVGNSTTKEHVIRRQLRTYPGYTFSRDAIQRSLRELVQLGYFNPETLIPETRINPETNTVDVTYQVEETGGSQLEFSGGWGGVGGGLLLQAGITLNNFSIQNFFKGDAWQPLPSGDGQLMSLNVQVQGRFFQSYSLSFQEPWFRGKPHPVGVSLSHTRYNLNQQFNRFLGQVVQVNDDPDNKISITSAQLSFGRRLKWPDDYFQTGSVLGWRFYNFGTRSSSYGLPPGQNHALTFQQRLSRNSLDNPLFPSSGSSFNLALEIAPPLPGFIQYHKWTFGSNWNLPIMGKLSLGVNADYGYVGSFNEDRVDFERYIVGGTPFDAQGGRFGFGRDLIYVRGYPSASIVPLNRDGTILGGSILNKYSSELRLMMATSPQFQLQSYAFLDAVNTWDGFGAYDPSKLFRSSGFGVRVFLPILGMLNLNYGYNFDAFPAQSGDDGLQKWRFQFSLGQSF